MPNIKSAKKRVKVIETKTLKNSIRKSALKTIKKKCIDAIAKKSEDANVLFKATVKAVKKAAAKNLVHKNKAARIESRLARAKNKMSEK